MRACESTERFMIYTDVYTYNYYDKFGRHHYLGTELSGALVYYIILLIKKNVGKHFVKQRQDCF